MSDDEKANRKGISALLPPSARFALVAAAGVDEGVARCESQERTMTLDRTIRSIKAKHPQFFKKGS